MGVINKTVITKDAFKVVGLEFDWQSSKEQPSDNAIARTWDDFNERVSEISHVIPKRFYGLMRFPNDWKVGEPHKYMACAEVIKFPSELPSGMIQAEIPSFEYAVLTYQGVIDEIRAANDYLFSEWAPTIEGFNFQFPHYFEFYGKNFTSNDDPNSVFELWVPLTGKK